MPSPIPFEPSKLTEEAKTHLPDMTALHSRRKALRLGMSYGEYLRDLVCLDIHGAPYDDLMREHRRNVRAQQGLCEGQLLPEASPEPASPVVMGVRGVV